MDRSKVNPDRHSTVAEFQHVVQEAMKTATRHFKFDQERPGTLPERLLVSRIVNGCFGA